MPRPTGTAFLLRRRARGISVADFIGFALSAPQADRLNLKAAILKAHYSPQTCSIAPVRGSVLKSGRAWLLVSASAEATKPADMTMGASETRV